MKVLLSVLLALGVVFSSSFVFAEELILEFDPDEELTAEDLADDSNQGIEQVSLPPPIPQKSAYIEGYRQLFEMNKDEMSGLEAVLLPLREDLSTIDTQLQVLSLQMQRILQQEAVIRQKMLGLQDLDDKLQVQEQLLALEMKDVVKKFERMLILFFRIKRQLVMEDGTVNLVQLFTTVSSPADMLFQDVLLQRIQGQMLYQMGIVSQQQYQLLLLRQSVEAVQQQLLLNQERVDESSQVLAQQREYQQQLLLEKRDEQTFFLQQLEAAQEEQLVILERVQEIATGVSNRDYRDFPQESFIWPVAPVLGISAYFKDQGYSKRFGLDHNAIDIPTDQLTPVKAPLSGRVLKVHDGGMGYSYLQLGHRDGFSTVYGHIYSSKVSEGDIVRQGQVIALSGGALGTKGAGRLTTGPHLHFEVLMSGNHVDPSIYLPNLGN